MASLDILSDILFYIISSIEVALVVYEKGLTSMGRELRMFLRDFAHSATHRRCGVCDTQVVSINTLRGQESGAAGDCINKVVLFWLTCPRQSIKYSQ